jgi:hypothetical protein
MNSVSKKGSNIENDIDLRMEEVTYAENIENDYIG